MARKDKTPVVVAELGRPETPGETAARKAENSRLYRQRKTVNNLVFSLLVSVGIMFVLVLIVPRGTDQWSDHAVDVGELAAQSSPTAGQPLIAPVVPESWKAKHAQLRADAAGSIVSWRIGYTTEHEGSEAYAEVVQAFTTDGEAVHEMWVDQQFEHQPPTGSERIAGLDWVVYDHPNRSADEANMIFGLQSQTGATTLLVSGTAHPEVLRSLAAEVAASAERIGLADVTLSTQKELS